MKHDADAAPATPRRALFLDRDGTLVHPRHYPRRPEELEIYDSLAAPLRALQGLGFALIVITNQSGVARGYLTESDLDRMHRWLADQLASGGVQLEATYFCPHHPEGSIQEYAVECDCRKPAPGMLVRAAAERDLDLSRSWFIGDILDDVEAGNRAGCRTVLVDLGTESIPGDESRRPDFVARDTRHALEIVLAHEGAGAAVELDYQPAAWSRQSALVAAGEAR